MTAAVKLGQALTKFDANRDQTLTEAQLVAILCRPGGVKPMAEAEARSWFRRLSGGADRVPMTTLVATWSGAVTGTIVSSANRNLPPARVRHLFKKVPFVPRHASAAKHLLWHFGALWCGRCRRPLTFEHPP